MRRYVNLYKSLYRCQLIMTALYYKCIPLALLLLLFCFSNTYATSDSVRNIKINRAVDEIILDGKLDELSWHEAEIAKDFHQQLPYDTTLSTTKTEVKVTYDDKYIYIGAICYDTFSCDYIVSSLIRDFSYPINDAFAVYIEPYGDFTNGFNFTVSPLGVQREGLIEGGGLRGVTTAWDNRWFSKVTRDTDKWIAEIAIPFKSIRYKENTDKWRINFSRNNLKINENSVWSSVPRNFNVATLGFTGELDWDEQPKKAGANISIIPYLLGSTYKDYNNESNSENKLNYGTDAKIGITSSLNLDLTVNPDFSQVEVDRQQTNLTRFSLFYPEKRQFFIENGDLFGNLGFSQIRPFFSRRIGLQNGQTVPIIGGARLSGKVNNDWRVGIMNIQTQSKPDLNLLGQNYFVAVTQRQIFKKSTIGLMMVNRQAFANNKFIANNYNRVLGIDYNLRSKNNKWTGILFYHQSFTPEKYSNTKAHASYLFYSTRNIQAMWNHEYVGENYITDAGFVPRLYHYDGVNDTTIRRTYWRTEPSITYIYYPKKSKYFINHSWTLYSSNYYDKNLNITDQKYNLGYIMQFINTGKLNLYANYYTTKLIFPIDVTATGSTPLPASNYIYQDINASYTSNSRKKFNYSTIIAYGSFYNGNIIGYSGSINYRAQPWGIFSISYTRNEIKLPLPYAQTNLDLLGANLVFSFTKSVFFSNYIQYNTQSDNFNINSRLQWRFKPMSDLYIVYTDNYITPNFYKKDKALVLKFIYWITV